MKKFICCLFILGLLCSPVFALEPNYFLQFLNKEIKVVYSVHSDSKTYSKETWLKLQRVDTMNKVLIGLTNFGVVHIPIETIVIVYEQLPGWHVINNTN